CARSRITTVVADWYFDVW
nr:immunoglobulin heavy chain junction region [Mus musculus]NSM05845.1 immunoglobulin heavy chain junction region [Mus musculus]NSM08067.1 immunoglobulin heavy chain junction region [Mus musculus]NSM08462.1 immunoglobulin heavy chain junction region [Mus musculus]NSM08473.1 immunoglobulin heavy chain junction region [Mus musculus]